MNYMVLLFLAQAAQSAHDDGSISTGVAGGGLIGAGSIVIALIAMFRFKEAAQRELIDTHKQRANESEARAKELAETHAALQAADIEVKKMFAEAMQAVASGKRALAEALTVLARAVEKRS